MQTFFPATKNYPGYIAVLVLFLVLKACFAIFAGVAADEAYYWVWGQDFALSYFDHPPLNAWLIGLTSLFFENSVFGMRLATFVSFAGTVYVYWLFSKELYGNQAQKSFLIIVAAFLASPTLFVWTTIVYNDHLLIFFGLASAYCFAKFFASVDQSRPLGKVKALYAAAALIGCAALAKYNAVFIGLAAALLVVGHPNLRRLLAGKHIYLAGILSLLFFAPVFIWNVQNDFASFNLHLVDRYSDPIFSVFLPAPFYRFILSTIIYFGPVLLLPMVLLYLPQKNLSQFATSTLWIARISIALSVIFFTLSASRGAVHWYWMAPSYAFMLLFLPLLLRNIWLLGLHFLLGAVFAVYATFNYAIAPVEVLLGTQSAEVQRMFGWQEFSNEVTSLAAQNPDFKIGTTHYTTAGQLAHALNSTEVYDLSPNSSHFSFVDRKDLNTGESAIILHDQFGELELTAKRFSSFTKIKTVTFEKFDKEINKVDIYLGEGYVGP